MQQFPGNAQPRVLSGQWNTLYNKRQRVGAALHPETMAVPPISLPSLFHHDRESGQLIHPWGEAGHRISCVFPGNRKVPAFSWLGAWPWYLVWCQLTSPSTDPHRFCSGRLWKCFTNLLFVILQHLEQSAGKGVVSVWNISQISAATRTECNSCCCRFRTERFLLH